MIDYGHDIRQEFLNRKRLERQARMDRFWRYFMLFAALYFVGHIIAAAIRAY